MYDSRQRAPFAHTSSSADLTSPDVLTPHRAFPQPRSPVDHASDIASSPWAKVGRKISAEQYNGGPYPDASPTRSRSPTPNPFQLPTFTYPGLATIRFVSLCVLWYASSAVSSNTGKVILNNFKYPVTLTIVQFFFVAGLCIACSSTGLTGTLRRPTEAILRGTLPMASFQVGGHIFSSLAISRVPVSTVHTIKALSPLFTVAAYALLFGVSYSPSTYLSLLPLTLGVMLACSFDLSLSNILGLVCAFGSTVIFVSQNIFFKKITHSETTTTSRLDKINLLYFSSGMAFVLMVPVWIYSDATRLVDHWLHGPDRVGGPSIALYFFLNGTVHFAQNLLAFAILSSTSPVTYSIASLVKRIAVICLAIIWFKQTVHVVQAFGITLTAVGLWMYNNAKRDVEKGEKKFRQVEAVRDGLLPSTRVDQRILEGDGKASPRPVYAPGFLPMSKSSAVRAYAPVSEPYPSPPASVTSSPPNELLSIHSSRQRRLSNDTKDDDHLRLPPPRAGPPPIMEHAAA